MTMFARRGLRPSLAGARAKLMRVARSAVQKGLGVVAEGAFRISGRRRAELGRRDQQRAVQAGLCFVADERALVAALARLIVPSEENAPGADEMDAAGPSAVRRIEEWTAASPARRRLYARGLLALDDMARATHGTGFAALAPAQQREVFAATERHGGRPGSRLRRELVGLHGMLRGWSPAVDLHPVIVEDTLKAFYTSEVAWIWLGYDGPPMPLGYPRLTEPQPRPRPLPVEPSHGMVSQPSFRPRSRTADAADVIVVGCGAGGAVVAKELAEAGLSVIVLEAGKRYEPARDYPTARWDFEIRGGAHFAAEDARRDEYTAGKRGFFYHRVKGVGGSTLHYDGMSPRLHQSDFRVRSEDGVADDWPLTYDDLEPFYTRVEYELGVSGPDGGNPFEPPRSRPYPTPPHAFNLAGQVIARGAERLGLHMVREPLALPTRDWHGRPACASAGTCEMGCQISAKSSMDVTFVRKAEATGRAQIRSECMAVDVELDDTGRARAVVYLDRNGRRHRVGARAIVLAGNAVETARLLLLNASSRFPDGLANSSGLVGRNFTEHLAVFATGLFPARVDPWRGPPTGGMIQDYYATRPDHGFVRGWTMIATNSHHWPLSVARRLPGWGTAHKRLVEKTFGHAVRVASIGEQLPDASNRVELDPMVTDHFGLPVPRLINEPRANDRAMIDAIKDKLATLLIAAGATEVVANDHAPGGSAHYLGTCRMGRDPRTSVVDAWGRSHDVPNLFIADGSVFVTGGAVNPALTISALAMRTAEGIVAAFRRREI